MKVKKKPLYRKIIVTIMTVLFAVTLYIPYIPKMKALSNVTTSNSYGGYTWQIHDMSIDMSGNATLQSGNISMNLNGHYNGSFTINISLSTIINTNGTGYTNSINKYGFIANGCVINGYDASHLYISIYDCNYWEIEIIPMVNATLTNPMPILNAFDILSITGWSMTKLDDITATQITTIQNTLTSINSNIITTNSRLSTTNTELHNIYNSIGNSATYGTIQTQLHGIAVNTTSMINELQDIDTHLSGYLTGTIDNQTVNIWDLQNDANYSLSNIESTLNTINNNINDYTSQLYAIQNTLNSINTNLQNIDNTIDTISWTDLSTITSISNNGNITEAINKLYTTNDVMLFPISSTQLQEIRDKQSAIYKMIIPIYIYRNDYTVKIGEYRNGNITYKNYNIYKRSTQNSLEIYLYIDKDTKDTFWNPQYISVEIDGSYYFYTDYTNKLQYIYETDIEYWSLMQYFNQYDMNQKILESIQSINMSVTNTTIQDTQTNITDYNNIYNQVSTVEQNYINQYNTNNTNLQSIINDKKGIPDNIVNVSTDIESKMGQLFTVPEFKYLFALIITGCVLIALLG